MYTGMSCFVCCMFVVDALVFICVGMHCNVYGKRIYCVVHVV